MFEFGNIEDKQFSYNEIKTLIGAALTEVFYASFQRKFGSPSESIRQKVDHASEIDLMEWIPNFVDACKIEDLFISKFEYAISRFAAFVLKRDFNIDASEARSFAEVIEACDRKNGSEGETPKPESLN